jgi:hypothetical protein
MSFVEIEIGIAIEIEDSCHTKLFESDFDSDCDPEKNSTDAFMVKLGVLTAQVLASYAQSA